MSRESKTLSFQVKDLGTRTDDSGQEFGQIEAYGAIFNNVDEGRDRILPGAFKRTIRNSKDRAASRQKKYLAPMLWQHDTKEVIGGWYEMDEDATGLRAKGDISLATQRGREYYALAKAQMADEFSIIYDVPAGGAKYDKSGVRDLSELRLFSIDPVTFAMNDATFVVGVKSTSEKRRGRHTMQRKTFQEHYQEEQCCDLLEDWQDVVLCAFTSAVYDAFSIGDSPESDVNDALDGLKEAVSEWVASAVKYGLADYLDEQSSDYDGGTSYRMQRGASRGYMSRQTPMHAKSRNAELKAMGASDATTGGFTADHVAKLHGAADKCMKAVERHVGALQDAAESVKSLAAGVNPSLPAKASVASMLAKHTQALSDHADALQGAADTLTKSATRHLGTVSNVADDLATILQGSEAAYGTDPGNPDGNQEGKTRSSGRAPRDTSLARASRQGVPPSPSADTVPAENDIADALSKLRTLRTPAA